VLCYRGVHASTGTQGSPQIGTSFRVRFERTGEKQNTKTPQRHAGRESVESSQDLRPSRSCEDRSVVSETDVVICR